VVEEAISGLIATNNGPTALDEVTTLTASISTGSNVTYIWDFGDGSSGSGDVVQHTYTEAGEFTATVTATNSVGEQNGTTVVVVEEAIGGLTAANDGPTTLGNVTVLTAIIAAGDNVTYQWDFGDGIGGSGAVVQHIYEDVGQFTAIVTATNLVSMETTSTIVTIASDMSYVFIPVMLKPN